MFSIALPSRKTSPLGQRNGEACSESGRPAGGPSPFGYGVALLAKYRVLELELVSPSTLIEGQGTFFQLQNGQIDGSSEDGANVATGPGPLA